MSLLSLSLLVPFVPSLFGQSDKSYLGLWNIEEMCRCSLNQSAELTYNGYGCFCGIGGNGTALDGIDACCQMHDLCYDLAVSAAFCSPADRYISRYHWKCQSWNRSATAQQMTMALCDEENNKQIACGRTICRCDQQLISCWSLFPKPQCKRKCVTGQCQSSVEAVLQTFKRIKRNKAS